MGNGPYTQYRCRSPSALGTVGIEKPGLKNILEQAGLSTDTLDIFSRMGSNWDIAGRTYWSLAFPPPLLSFFFGVYFSSKRECARFLKFEVEFFVGFLSFAYGLNNKKIKIPPKRN